MISKATFNKQRKYYLLITLAFIFFSTNTHATDARDIMKKVDDRYRGNSWIMDSNVLLIDKNKRRSERQLRIKGKMYAKDEKTITYVLEPARIRGTGILSYDWHDPKRENESWLYLPDLGKVTRLTTANRADYFLGTDFTYGDLEGLEVDDFSYQTSNNEKSEINEIVIDAEPINPNGINKYGYRKIRYWVDINKDVINKAQYWLKDNGWVKYYRQFEFKKIDGVWLADREQMSITKHKQLIHTTIITRGDIEVNADIDDSLFTTNSLERVGR